MLAVEADGSVRTLTRSGKHSPQDVLIGWMRERVMNDAKVLAWTLKSCR